MEFVEVHFKIRVYLCESVAILILANMNSKSLTLYGLVAIT